MQRKPADSLIRISFLARTTRIPKRKEFEDSKPMRVSFLSKLKKPKLRHTEEVRDEGKNKQEQGASL